MARNQTLHYERNKRIYSKYKDLYNKQIGGKRLYTYDAIMNMLSTEFYLMPDTISKIVQNFRYQPTEIV